MILSSVNSVDVLTTAQRTTIAICVKTIVAYTPPVQQIRMYTSMGVLSYLSNVVNAFNVRPEPRCSWDIGFGYVSLRKSFRSATTVG
jgi:hypothetical protein